MSVKKILVIGYSLTIQSDGYISELKRNSTEKIDIFAIGGANWHSTLYTMNLINLNDYALILFEIATCARWLGNGEHTRGRYEKILEIIISHVIAKNIPCGFLNFTRHDINHDNDPMLKAICNISQKYGAPSSEFPEILGELKNFLYDGIHTKNAGAILYANLALDLINQIKVFSRYPNQPPKGVNSITYSQPVSCQDNASLESFRFNKGGLNERFYKIHEGNKLIVINGSEEDIWIRGLMLKIGPETGTIKISKAGECLFSKLCFDDRSYYERYFPLFTPAIKLKKTDRIIITCQHEVNRPKLQKGENYLGPQSISISHHFASTEYPTP